MSTPMKSELTTRDSYEQLPDGARQRKESAVKRLLYRVLAYYSHVSAPKEGPAQSLEDVRIYFGLVRCRPWIIIIAGIITQFLYGSVYSWSIFNGPINERIYGDPNANKAQIAYYLALGVLGLTGALMGPWIESHQPRISTLIGALLFFAGNMISGVAMSAKLIGLLYFGYGFVCGMGLGLGYVATVDVVTKWFPKTRGLASGIAVAGFGAGSMAFSTVNKALIDRLGLPATFFLLGAIMLVAQGNCSQLMAIPPAGWNTNGVVVVGGSEAISAQGRENIGRVLGQGPVAEGAMDGPQHHHHQQQQQHSELFESNRPVVHLSLAAALSSRDFWFLYVGFLANILFGLVIISNLATMVTNLFGEPGARGRPPPLSPEVVVTIEAGFNTAGRLFTGMFSDRLGRKTTFLGLLGVQVVVIALLQHALVDTVFWEFCVLLWVATWCYGGGFGMIPAFLADMFGVNNTSSCHGIFLTAWSISSIGGGLLFNGIITHLQDHGRSPSDPYIYRVNLYWMLAVVIVGFLSTLLVRATARDRLFPAAPGQVLRMRVFGRIFRVCHVREDAVSIEAGMHQHLHYQLESASTLSRPGSPSALTHDRARSHRGRGRRSTAAGMLRRWKFELLTADQEQAMWEEYLLLRAIQSRLRTAAMAYSHDAVPS